MSPSARTVNQDQTSLFPRAAMSPSCPGPGPCPGPETLPVSQPVSEETIAVSIARAAALYGQLVAKFLSAVGTAANQGVATVTGLMNTFDTPLTAGATQGTTL